MPPWCKKWVFFGVFIALSVTPANAQTYIGFDLSDVPVPESTGTATLGLTRSGDVSGESLVTATVTPLTATAGTDYNSPVATNITFSANETSYNFTININDDVIVENTESFFVQLTTTDGNINITQPNITVSITDNDKATFSFASSSYSVEEDTGYVTVNITKTGTSDISLDVK
ncbi:extracellular matrix organizing protein FRAS1-like [Nematostella vectensis]|uniref:extracellular matrix organizing protein FRAS1-like n=1 Tax=Nematostella vectensis TaxID=45351 RepID=UPI00207755C7|nr:extracellular matrix organizing protein FRAS1-like [Nematostella vectensis]